LELLLNHFILLQALKMDILLVVEVEDLLLLWHQIVLEV
jgi:hypothetical protein